MSAVLDRVRASLAPRMEQLRGVLERFRELRVRHMRLLFVPICAPAVVLLYQAGDVIASRVFYPMDVEWMEGGALLHAYRLLHGLPLFTKPGSGFMPYPYPPGHTLLLAFFGAVFGVDYAEGRLISIAAICTAGVLLAREVKRQFESSPLPLAWAVLALGAMAAGFPVTGYWYDLVRSDSLALCLPVCAALLVNADGEWTRARLLGVGALMVAAFFSKQTCVFYIAWLLVFAFFRSPLHAILLGLGVGVAIAVLVGLLQLATHGYYLHYTVELLKKHRVFTERFGIGFETVLKFAPYLAVLPVISGALAWVGLLSRRAVLWNGMLAVSFAASLLPYAKGGGYINNFLPVVMLAAPAALASLGDLVSAVKDPRATGALSLVFAVAFSFYLSEREFDHTSKRATPERYAAAKRVNAFVKGLEGGVLIPYFPFLAVRNGQKTEQFHAMPWVDAEWANEIYDYTGYVHRVGARYLLLTGEEDDVVPRSFANGYVVTRNLPREMLRAETFVANSMHLRFVLERRDPSPKGRCVADFESGNYDGWDVQGDAFRGGPSPVRPPRQGIIVGTEGRYLANSFVPGAGDRARGTLVSPPFAIDDERLVLRVGGGSGHGTRVELDVDGEVVAQASGSRSEFLREVVWDVARYRGRMAQLSIIDEDGGAWGHILVDAVCWGSRVGAPQ